MDAVPLDGLGQHHVFTATPVVIHVLPSAGVHKTQKKKRRMHTGAPSRLFYQLCVASSALIGMKA